MAAAPSEPNSKGVQEEGTTTASSTTTTSTSPLLQQDDAVVVAAAAAESANKKSASPSNEASTTEAESSMTTCLFPTYESAESSDEYKLAKTYLNDGDFEQALSMIEQGIHNHQKQLRATKQQDDNTEEAEMHPCLAPFHYLYGTTLLYSIEEATDDDAATPVTLPPSSAMQNENEPSQTSPETHNNEENPTLDGNPNSDGNSNDEPEGGNPNPSNADDHADDIQIAFENLDLSRVLLEQYLQQQQAQPQRTTEHVRKLNLDLAQIYLREGDLQRLQGQYQAAAQDYETCRQLRQQYSADTRALADVHYNLALMHNMIVASQETTTEEHKLSPEQVKKHQQQMLQQYWNCAQCLAALILNQAGFHDADELQAFWDHATPADLTEDETKALSARLASLRQHLLQHSTVGEATTDTMQVLDEIQETIDELHNTTTGLQEMTALKSQITAAVAAQAGTLHNNNSDSQTSNDDNHTAPQETNHFGSSAATTLTATANTTLQVRRKPKRTLPANEHELPTKKQTSNNQ